MQKFSITNDLQNILITDKDGYELHENDIIKGYIKENDLLILVDKQEQNLQQQNQQNDKNEQEEQNNKSELQQQQQQKKLDDPVEAIVVLLDTSGSMKFQFLDDKLISRKGAVNAMFSAFADKTISFEYNHIVKLILFSDIVEEQCEFTSDFNNFIKLVDSCHTGGSTKCYDALNFAVDSLLKIQQKYPKIVPRIIALTDGEDNASIVSPQQVIQKIRQNNIILDSFVVGTNCLSLKNITQASGGRCYCPTNINHALQLFEIETILSVSLRPKLNFNKEDVIDLNVYNQLPFDQEGIKVVVQGVNDQVLTTEQLHEKIKKYQENESLVNQNAQKNNKGKITRIMKELNQILNSPSNYYLLFATIDNLDIMKILLKGPKGTFYEGGIYQLIMNIPNDYPFKPPSARFLNKIYHCNVNNEGKMCLDIIKDQWNPSMTIEKIILTIFSMISNPNYDDALDSTIASQMKLEPDIYQQQIIFYKEKYATFTANQLAAFVLGDSVPNDDPKFINQVQEISKWLSDS